MENLYVKEFIEYYIKLEIAHNEPYEESINNDKHERYKKSNYL